MKMGKFIVIDGTDGSGKGTQATILAQKLVLEGFETEGADFPQYGQESARMVELYLTGAFGTAEEVGPYAASSFYAIDRWTAGKKMKQQLEDGKVIVSNRWVSSNAGHQAGKISDPAQREEFLRWLFDLEYDKFKLPKPDLNILLYVPPEIGQQLVNQKAQRDYLDGKKMDIHEADLGHLRAASSAYLEVARKMDWTIIDCAPDGQMKSIEEVSALIWQAVSPVLNSSAKNMAVQPISQEVTILGYTEGRAHPEFAKLIESAGRTCYKSFEKASVGSDARFVDMVMRSGHESVIEHSWFVFLIEKYAGLKEDLLKIMLANNFFAITERENGDYLISGNARMWRNYFHKLIKNNDLNNKFLSLTLLKLLQAESPILFGDIQIVQTDNAMFNKATLNPEIDWTRAEKMKHFWTIIRFKGYTRAFTHQLVRHRPTAISQESQRYCDESGFYQNGYFVIPPSVKEAGQTENYLQMLESIDNNYKALQNLTDLSGKRLIKNEDARFLLPNACCSEIVMSANLYEWHWLLKMRCDKHAQWEIREAAMNTLRQLQVIFPGCFDDFIISEDGESASLGE